MDLVRICVDSSNANADYHMEANMARELFRRGVIAMVSILPHPNEWMYEDRNRIFVMHKKVPKRGDRILAGV